MNDDKENIGRNFFLALCASIFLVFFTAILFGIMNSCTYNVSLVHTEGQATNVGDETADADPDISPNLSLPLTTP